MAQRTWLIRGGRVVDPASGRDETADVLIRDGRIAEVGRIGDAAGATVVDANGLIVAPGFVDLHVHLREPGGEAKETIATGTAAAAAGGFTTICCMPNTSPALDSADVLDDLRRRVAHDGVVKVHPIAAITRGRAGKEVVDFDALAAAGAIGFSDDGDTTADSSLMRKALEASKRLGRPVMVHCEDKTLARGAMNEGHVSRRLEVAGIPPQAEEIIIARDTLLARLTGGWLHVCHVTTGHGAEIVRQAKRDGAWVTAEVMPHHLTMDDEWVAGSRTFLNSQAPAGVPGRAADPNTKVNPPLRTKRDTELLLAALMDNTIDIVATDHAPHEPATKSGTTFERAANGLSGLEFALPLMLGLVRVSALTPPTPGPLPTSPDTGEEHLPMLGEGGLSVPSPKVGRGSPRRGGVRAVSVTDLVTWLSYRPAKLLHAPVGTLAPGAPADVVVFDPQERWTVRADQLKTKSANTPLLGMELQGRVKLTLVDGQERYRD